VNPDGYDTIQSPYDGDIRHLTELMHRIPSFLKLDLTLQPLPACTARISNENR
jgi:hypothetical protein